MARVNITDADRKVLAEKIRETIDKLSKKAFKADHLVTPASSIATSVVSSAYKRHGYVLEAAIIVALNTIPIDFCAWSEEITLPGPTSKTQQVDIFVIDKNKNSLSAYEVKRGSGKQDSNSVRSIKDRFADLHAYLPSHTLDHGSNIVPATFNVAAISILGELGDIAPYAVLKKQDLDTHFASGIAAFIDEVDDYYRFRLLTYVFPQYINAMREISGVLLESTGRSVDDRLGAIFEEVKTESRKHPWDSL